MAASMRVTRRIQPVGFVGLPGCRAVSFSRRDNCRWFIIFSASSPVKIFQSMTSPMNLFSRVFGLNRFLPVEQTNRVSAGGSQRSAHA